MLLQQYSIQVLGRNNHHVKHTFSLHTNYFVKNFVTECSYFYGQIKSHCCNLFLSKSEYKIKIVVVVVVKEN